MNMNKNHSTLILLNSIIKECSRIFLVYNPNLMVGFTFLEENEIISYFPFNNTKVV